MLLTVWRRQKHFVRTENGQTGESVGVETATESDLTENSGFAFGHIVSTVDDEVELYVLRTCRATGVYRLGRHWGVVTRVANDGKSRWPTFNRLW